MSISIRHQLEPSDCFFLFAWRLLPDVKRWSIKEAPSWPEHLLYFEDLLNAQQERRIRAYVALVHGMPAGVLVTVNGEVNIMISELHRRKGVAKALIRAAQEQEPHLIAHVIIGNVVAAKLFASSDFQLAATTQKAHKACVTFIWRPKDEERPDHHSGE